MTTKKPGKPPLAKRTPEQQAVIDGSAERTQKEYVFRSRMGHVIADSKKLADGSVVGGVARMALAKGVNTNAERALAEAEELLNLPDFPQVKERLQRAAKRLYEDPSDATPNEIRALAESVLAHLPKRGK